MNVLCCLILSVTLAAGAVEPPSEPIDLFGAIRIALAHNPELERAEAQVRQAEARLLEAKSRFYPTVSLESELLESDAPSSYLFKKRDQPIVSCESSVSRYHGSLPGDVRQAPDPGWVA